MAKTVGMARCMWRYIGCGQHVETPYGIAWPYYQPFRRWSERYLRRFAQRRIP